MSYHRIQPQGLGFSLKPPRFARKAVRGVGRVVRSGAAIAASSLIPGAGLVIGSRKAPRFLRAPGGVRKFVRTAAKVQIAAGAVIAAGLFAPELAQLLPLAQKFLPKGGAGSPGSGGGGGGADGSGWPGPGGGDGGGGGGGGSESGSAPMDQQEDSGAPAPTTQAGGGALLAGGLGLLALIAISRRRG